MTGIRPIPRRRPTSTGSTRRKFLAGLALATLAGPVYARWVEPRCLDISRRQIQLGEAANPSPLRILHLSDLHASPEVDLRFIEKAVRLGLDLGPDLICLTGDFITARFDCFDRYAAILSKAAQQVPTYACLGNHDGGRWAASVGGYTDTAAVRRLLARSGIELLFNCNVSVRLGNRDLRLVGLGDLWATEISPEPAFAAVRPEKDRLTVVLSHNPDSKDALKAFPWDLLLCGHTHGGQFRLPLIGTPFAPVEDKRYVMGAHRWEGRWLHVSKGIGNVYGLRFNCRPEITLLTVI